MAEDFLSDAAKGADHALKNNGDAKNPYKINRNGSETAQIRTDTLGEVRFIATVTHEKIINVLDDLIQIGLEDPKYKDLVSLYQKTQNALENSKK